MKKLLSILADTGFEIGKLGQAENYSERIPPAGGTDEAVARIPRAAKSFERAGHISAPRRS